MFHLVASQWVRGCIRNCTLPWTQPDDNIPQHESLKIHTSDIIRPYSIKFGTNISRPLEQLYCYEVCICLLKQYPVLSRKVCFVTKLEFNYISSCQTTEVILWQRSKRITRLLLLLWFRSQIRNPCHFTVSMRLYFTAVIVAHMCTLTWISISMTQIKYAIAYLINEIHKNENKLLKPTNWRKFITISDYNINNKLNPI